MLNANPTSQSIARAYFEAMASKKVEGILALCDGNITCDSPLGHLEGIGQFRGFQEDLVG